MLDHFSLDTKDLGDLRRRVTELEDRLREHQRLAETFATSPDLSTEGLAAYTCAIADGIVATTNVDYVLLGLLNDQHDALQSAIVSADGSLISESTAPVAESAFQALVDSRQMYFAESAQELLPTDLALQQLHVESFAAVPLFSSDGTPLGLLALMSSAARNNSEAVERVLTLFARLVEREIERSHSDRALKDTEARFRTLCEKAPLGIFECDEAGFCTYVNPAWTRVSGRPAEDSLGYAWRNIIHPDDRDRLLADWNRDTSEIDSWQSEFRVLKAEGEVRWVHATAVRVRQGGASTASFVGTIEDVTEPKLAELALEESEGRFRAFMDHSPAVAFIKDAHGRKVYANRPYIELFGVGGEDVIGRTDSEQFGQKLASELRQTDEGVLATGQAIQKIEILPTPDGVFRHWLVYKFPVNIASGQRLLGGVAIDITDRQRVEEQLRQARDELELRVNERTQSLMVVNRRLQQEAYERERADAALRAEQVVLRQILSNHEADRKLIAYEIHDGLVQYNAAALMHLETFKQTHAIDGEANGSFETALNLLRQTIREARRLISGLQPMMLEEAGLAAAIDCLIRDSGNDQAIDFDHNLGDERLPHLVESALFRICQEALTNARKYSQSSRVRVKLRKENATATLEVVDDGIGFDIDSLTARTFGLYGIRQRARLLGGHASIESVPGQGTRVSVSIPIRDVEPLLEGGKN